MKGASFFIAVSFRRDIVNFRSNPVLKPDGTAAFRLFVAFSLLKWGPYHNPTRELEAPASPGLFSRTASGCL
jgi:hypothetical protein